MRLVVRAVGYPPSKRDGDYASKKLNRLGRLVGTVDDAELVYREAKPGQRVDLTLHCGGQVFRASAHDVVVRCAIDNVVSRVESQIRKCHGKLVDHAEARGKRVIADGEAVDHRLPDDAGHVVDTKTIALRPMTLSEATLAFEVSKMPFFPFHNVETAVPEVVYRRESGGLGVMRLR